MGWVLAAAAAASVLAPAPLDPALRAIADLEQDEATHHDVEHAYAIATLHERLGHWNEATSIYRDYVREAGDGAAHGLEANQAIDRIEHAAGFIRVRADVGFDRRVWLDGRAQPAAPPVTLLAVPGTHVVRGSGTAGSIERTVEVEAKQLVEVWLGPGDSPVPPVRGGGCAACVVDRGSPSPSNAPASKAGGAAVAIVVLALARRRARE